MTHASSLGCLWNQQKGHIPDKEKENGDGDGDDDDDNDDDDDDDGDGDGDGGNDEDEEDQEVDCGRPATYKSDISNIWRWWPFTSFL